MKKSTSISDDERHVWPDNIVRELTLDVKAGEAFPGHVSIHFVDPRKGWSMEFYPSTADEFAAFIFDKSLTSRINWWNRIWKWGDSWRKTNGCPVGSYSFDIGENDKTRTNITPEVMELLIGLLNGTLKV